MKKRLFGSLLAGFVAISATAQVSSTLSPYSQFGVGVLADQSQGLGRAMGGLGIGLRDSKHPNVLNPASYSAVDSLTMVFDLGVSGQLTSFKEETQRVNRKTADFDYAVALFRVLPRLGACFGVIPYSNIGYNYYNKQTIGSESGKVSESTYTNTYSGSGGFSQAFIGLGWEVFNGFSLGANVSYLWGKYSKTVSGVFADSYANSLTRNYSINVNSWKLDLGAQVVTKLGKDDRLTFGVVAGIGHTMHGDAVLAVRNTNSNTGVTTSTNDTIANALSLPYTFGAGLSLTHKQSLTVGVDYSMQRWGKLDYPQVNEETNKYQLASGLLKDRHKVAVGADWVPDPNPLSRGFFKHIHYRIGASYATPYYNIGNLEGPKELSVSAGFGIPIINTWNNRTSLNISAQWVRTSADNLITENTFRINIGLTFNERWFAKWKVD